MKSAAIRQQFLDKAKELNPEQAKELDWSYINTYNEMKRDEPATKLLNNIIAENRPDKDEAYFTYISFGFGCDSGRITTRIKLF